MATTEIYQIFYESKTITSFFGKINSDFERKECVIKCVTSGDFIPGQVILILMSRIETVGWNGLIPDEFQSMKNHFLKTVHNLDLGQAARLCVQKADEYFEEMSLVFCPDKKSNNSAQNQHPYRSLPTGSKLL